MSGKQFSLPLFIPLPLSRRKNGSRRIRNTGYRTFESGQGEEISPSFLPVFPKNTLKTVV